MPPFELLTNVDFLFDSVVVGVLCYCFSISMAKIFARQFKYNLDDRQELLSEVSVNIIGVNTI